MKRTPIKESEIRDLAAELYDTAVRHAAFAQIADIISNANDHMLARARIEELNRGEHVLETSFSRITVQTLSLWLYHLVVDFPEFHYAETTIDGLRIVTTGGKHFKVTITEE